MTSFRTFLLAALFSLSAGAVSAQSDKDKPLTDAERARRDAEKVFSFIKFHTVKPAAPAAAANARPAPAAATAPTPRPVATATAPVTPPAQAAPVSRGAGLVLASAAPAAAAASAPGSNSLNGSNSANSVNGTNGAQLASAAPAASGTLGSAPAASSGGNAFQPNQPGTSLPPAAEPSPTLPATPSPAQAEPVVEEEEEVPLKLIAYVAPAMTQQVQDAIIGSQALVTVRFVVQPDGRVSSAQAVGNANRRLVQAATRAVQQWRFDPIPEVREVDVEIAFRLGED